MKLIIANPDIPKGLYITDPVYYKPQGNEVRYLLLKYAAGTPMGLKGPTGTGKTRLFTHIAYLLGAGFEEIQKMNLPAQVMGLLEQKTEQFRKTGFPLFTVPCNEDTTIEKLVGQPGFDGTNAYWTMGYASLAAKHGGMLYLDEVDRARPDIRPALNELTDDRRQLTVLDLAETYSCPPSFWATIAFNPFYGRNKLTPDFRGRFGMLQLGYADEATETEIIMHEASADKNIAAALRKIAEATRHMATDLVIPEGANPRQLINAARQINLGETFLAACMGEIGNALTDDGEKLEAIQKTIEAHDPTLSRKKR